MAFIAGIQGGLQLKEDNGQRPLRNSSLKLLQYQSELEYHEKWKLINFTGYGTNSSGSIHANVLDV